MPPWKGIFLVKQNSAYANYKGKIIAVVLVTIVSLYGFCLGQLPTVNEATVMFSNKSVTFASASTTVTHSNDTNWAGYIIASDVQNPQATVTSVTATWTVPTVKISAQDTFSAVWIGIGGFYDTTLIQTGTEQDSIQGQSEYSAWVELLPQSSITIDSLIVSPGDQINASIQLIDANTDQWSVYIKDLTTNQEYTNNFVYASSQLSAEWIVERPDITSSRARGTLTSLADVGLVTFTGCQATIGGTKGAISDFPVVESIMYENVQTTDNLGVTQLAAVSNLTDNGSSFTVETSQAYIPEISVLMLIPLVVGTSLLAILAKKRAKN